MPYHIKSYLLFIFIFLISSCSQNSENKIDIPKDFLKHVIPEENYYYNKRFVSDYLQPFPDSNLFYSTSYIEKTKSFISFDEISREMVKPSNVQKIEIYDFIFKEAKKHPIINYFDSISNEQIRRFLVPKILSEKFIPCNKIIWVYNNQSQLIAKGNFRQDEVFEDRYQSKIVSVYNLDYFNKNKTDKPFYYGTEKNEATNDVKQINQHQIKKVTSDDRHGHIAIYDFEELKDSKFFHYKFKDKVYTFVSNKHITMYITENGKTYIPCFDFIEGKILDVTPTHFIKGENPVFLISYRKENSNQVLSSTYLQVSNKQNEDLVYLAN